MLPFPSALLMMQAQVPPSGPVLPAGITPYAWYDADSITGPDNTEIVTLSDISGNARNWARLTAQGPLLKTNVLNGRKVIQLYETPSATLTQTIMTISNSFLASPTAASYFMVFKNFNDPGSSPYQDQGPFGQIENHAGDTHMPYNNGNCYTGFCSNARRSYNPAPALNVWRIWNERSAANDWGVYIDGYSITSSATNTVDSGTATRQFGRGGEASSGMGNFHGQVAEVLFFNSVLGTSDRQKVEGYLAHRWGLTGQLDATHPYKTTPPS